MSYVSKALSQGEVLEYTARMHWILGLRAWLALIFLGIFVVGIVIFVRDMIFLSSTEVALTNRRLIYKTGLFHRDTSDLILDSVETVKIHQSLWGRLMSFGRVSVHGTGTEIWTTPLIADPIAFRQAIASGRSNDRPAPAKA